MRRNKGHNGEFSLQPQVILTFNNVNGSSQKFYGKTTSEVVNPAGNIKGIIVYNANNEVVYRNFDTFPENPWTFNQYNISGTGPFVVEYYFNDVTKIVNSTFSITDRVVNVEISNDIELIKANAFAYLLHGLTPTYNFYIPTSVTRIEAFVFNSYSGALNICFASATPPTIVTNTFAGTGNTIVCIGDADVDVYKAAWPAYADIIVDGH